MWSSNLQILGLATSSVLQSWTEGLQIVMLEVQRIMVRCRRHIHARFPKLIFLKGAPECHRSDEFLEQSKLNVKPLIDIWSFGGVCSEAAVWVVLGISGLIDYRGRRQQEICEKGTSQDGSCFHDGEKVLKTVEAMHNRLVKGGEVRPGDHVTKCVLDQMVTSMLEEDPDGRQNTIWLWKRSQKILKEAQLELKKSNKQTALIQVNPKFNNDKAQLFRLNKPEITTPASHGAAQPYNQNHFAHGPPPNYPQYNSNFPLPSRSDTRHEHSTKPDIAPSPLHGSPSPPIAIRQPPGASPPLDTYPVLQEQTKFHATASDETATLHGEKSWQNVNPVSYSPLNGSRDSSPLKSASVPRLGICDLSLPETETGAKFHAQQTQGCPTPASYQNSAAFGPSPDSNPKHPKVAKVSTSDEKSHPMTIITSGEASQRSPPKPPSLFSFQISFSLSLNINR